MVKRERLLEKTIDILYDEYILYCSNPKLKSHFILEASVSLKKETPVILTKRSEIV